MYIQKKYVYFKNNKIKRLFDFQFLCCEIYIEELFFFHSQDLSMIIFGVMRG